MDRRQVLGLAIACSCVSPLAHAGATKSFRIVTAHLPPLAIEGGGERPGALHEVVLELLRRLQLNPAVEFLPWSRALLIAAKMPATAIFPVTRQADREHTYRWLVPLREENYVFLARRGSSFDLRQPERMKASRIVFLRGGAQASLLRRLGYNNTVETRTIAEVHRFLTAGMADAAMGERAIVQASLKSGGTEQQFDLSAPVHSPTAWLAGSLDFDDNDVQRFQRAMAEMVADGSYRRILARYDLA